MTTLDLFCAAIPLAATLTAGVVFSRIKGVSLQDFVLGGRRLSWWLAGTAMVAGASNADSPLHQSGKIRRDGLVGAWFYWSQVLGQLFGALVFSRLWRRTGLTTVVEFYDLRYAGRAGALGRICSMVSSTFIDGTFSIALGLLAVGKISAVFVDFREPLLIGSLEIAPSFVIGVGALALAGCYSILSGLRGVVAGDVVEFVITLACSYLLMWVVWRAVGGEAGLREGLTRLGRSAELSYMPAWGLSLFVFFVVHPLATAAGVNSINQRFLSLKDERQSVLSGVWRVANHYFVRCWPWHICGLCSLVLLADGVARHELAYTELIVSYAPAGLKGLMLGGLVIAFMGTASASMHTCGAVFVNDFYRVHCVRGASDRHYVWVVRCAMGVAGGVGLLVATEAEHILGLLQLFNKVVGAAGLLLLLRWFWWRVNGWADVAAQVSALPVALFYEQADRLLGPEHNPVRWLASRFGAGSPDEYFAASFLLTVGTTTCIWLVVLFLTQPEPMNQLEEFYRRVRPYGAWGPVAKRCPDVVVTDRFVRDARHYALGLVGCGGLLLGGAEFFLGNGWVALGWLTAAGAGLALLVRSINRA